MQGQNSQLDFTGQDFFIGLDVHKRNWTTTIRLNGMLLKTFTMNPSPKELANYLRSHYPDGNYHSVYEAGFCGFWIHRQLRELGINNIVINPADVPTTHKEKVNKRDKVDSRKLARELENNSLEAIYVPDEFHEQFRGLVRYRYRLIKRQIQMKNRIKAHLHLHSIELPARDEMSHWSGAFIKWLESLEFSYCFGKDYLCLCLEELKEVRQRLANVVRLLRAYVKAHPDLNRIILQCIGSVPGIGFISALTFYSEIIDIHRFRKLDNLCSFIGLVPSVSSSDENERVGGLTPRRNRYLRYLIIEASWIAVRTDPALTLAFNELSKRMKKQDAIIRIAKKLVNRVRYVWRTQTCYSPCVVQ